ncbi:MAG: glycosyltransferase family 4 protein, partial [Cyanobacteriota bacterium]
LIIIQNRETQFDAPLYVLIHQQQSFGLEVIYTTPTSQGFERDEELGFAPRWDHLQGRAYPHRYLRSTTPLAIWRLASQLRRKRPRLVVICGYFPRCQLLLAILLRLMGQRIGLRSDNTLSHTTFHGLRGRLRRLGIGPIQRLFHTWHPVGEQALAYLRTLSGVQRPSHRFAYAVDNDWFASAAASARADRPSLFAELGWPDDAFVVLGILKWHPREDPLTLVRGFALLLARCPRARLILVGDGPLRESVQAELAPLGPAVHTPGYVPYGELPRWYAMADVFVHPSPNEPWGVSVNEAMACGLPVVAADGVGAAHELIEPGASGAVVPDRDPAALASVLTALALDPVLVRSWGERGRSRIAAWSYTHTIASFAKAIAN